MTAVTVLMTMVIMIMTITITITITTTIITTSLLYRYIGNVNKQITWTSASASLLAIPLSVELDNKHPWISEKQHKR